MALPGWSGALALPALAELSPPAAVGPAWQLMVLLAALGVAGFGALATAGLLGYSPTLLAELLTERDWPDREPLAADVQKRGDEYLAVAMLYSALGWVAGLWVLVDPAGPLAGPWAAPAFVAAMLLFAGSLPLVVARVRAERVLLATRPGILAGWFLLRWPVVWPWLQVTRLLAWLLGLARGRKPTDAASRHKQVMAAVADSVPATELAAEERTWIGNILALQDQQVSAVMRPRPDMIGFPADLPLRDAIAKALEHGFSRYPVYAQSLDEITGVFYVKDALRLLQDEPDRHRDATVGSMLRPPLFVPATMGLAQLLRRFQKGHLHMAIVLDEYGTTAGLVSVEDVLEQIVGDIGDEYDSPSESEPDALRVDVVEPGRVVEVPGRLDVATLSRALGVQLPQDGDYETVAGLVIATCNRIPKVGEQVVVGDAEFQVLAADPKRIDRLRVTALATDREGAA
ncbi:MAG: HlyC/CorC family transporter [Planctomycetes bacterium]|nr:HlyC/CorC family transporter [Planctomycetota bacterium]